MDFPIDKMRKFRRKARLARNAEKRSVHYALFDAFDNKLKIGMAESERGAFSWKVVVNGESFNYDDADLNGAEKTYVLGRTGIVAFGKNNKMAAQKVLSELKKRLRYAELDAENAKAELENAKKTLTKRIQEAETDIELKRGQVDVAEKGVAAIGD